jgi:LCP family protein required for cell wall assembly
MRRHDDSGDPDWSASRSRRAPQPRRPGRWRRGHSTTTLVLGTLAVVVALVFAGGSVGAYLEYHEVWDSITRINVQGDLTTKNRPPADPHAQNILLIGSDSRTGQNGKIGGSDGIEGARSDTVMILHIAPGAHQVVVLSVPRDSVVPILNCTAEDGTPGQTAQPDSEVEQINTTFADGGPGCLWETVEQTTGIHIDDFVEMTFVGFEHVIDAIHGVNVCLPEAVNDPDSGLNLPAGEHHVYGKEALAFWRTREDLGEGDDPQRIQRDQYLMAALVQGIERSGLMGSPSKMLDVVGALTSGGFVTTDSGLTQGKMLQIAEAIRGISNKSIQFVTAPWNTYTGNAQWVASSQTPTSGNADWVQWQQPQANNLFSAIAHDTSLPKSSKSKAKTVTVQPAAVDVKVLNGTGTYGLAATTATSLSGRGFHVTGTPGDASTSDYTNSVIEYATPLQLPAAETLAKAIGNNPRLVQDGHLKNGTLHLIIGSNFTALAAATGNTGIEGLATTYGGITADTNICSDSSAFAGPDGG